MKTLLEEIRLQGSPICTGVAIGKPYFFSVEEQATTEVSITPKGVNGEIKRFREALKYCEEELKLIRGQLEAEGAIEGATILDTQLELMKDPLICSEVENGISQEKKNAEAIFIGLIKLYEKRFDQITDHFFRERFKDILDVCRRIMDALKKRARRTLDDVPTNSIVFSNDLAPSDTASAKTSQVNAFVTATGGGTSHAAIVAKAKGIPFVTNVDFSVMEKEADSEVIVDGRTGDIILNPSRETLDKYRSVQQQIEGRFRDLEKAGFLDAETYDGYSVRLSANVEMISDVTTLQEYGSGIGLFRSEYIVLSKDDFPTEEEQFVIYRRLVEKMQGLPVVIRTFDIGGDKVLERQNGSDAAFAGYRATRLMLKEKDIFKTQLRAILRAAAYGDLSIMFPMVNGPTELRQAKAMLKEARQELARSRKKVGGRIPIGCMIEVPAAAVICDVLAKECDFLSIGTNDLVQYALAVDRGTPLDSTVYSPTHPAVIRLIKMVVAEGARHGIPVKVCGEVAADPKFTALLLGLGVRELSVALRHIPIVKNVVRNTSIVSASQMAERVLTLSTSQEVHDLLCEEYHKIMPGHSDIDCGVW